MATGLKVPVGASIGGGFAVESDPEQLRKVLREAFLPGDDDNPFQSLGLSEKVVFSINDPGAVALAQNSVRKILDKFSDRVALDTSIGIRVRQDVEGELNLFFRYVDLETNRVTDFDEVIG